MDRRFRSGLAGGIVLILLGVMFLVLQIVPGLGEAFVWPLVIVGVGLLMLIVGIATGVSGLAVPACIVAGIGGILYWQNATDNWTSWAYTWTLIPGFVGLGILIARAIEGKFRQGLRDGLGLIVTSLVLLVIFGAIFGLVGAGLTEGYWPVLLIALGVLILAWRFIRRR